MRELCFEGYSIRSPGEALFSALRSAIEGLDQEGDFNIAVEPVVETAGGYMCTVRITFPSTSRAGDTKGKDKNLVRKGDGRHASEQESRDKNKKDSRTKTGKKQNREQSRENDENSPFDDWALRGAGGELFMTYKHLQEWLDHLNSFAANSLQEDDDRTAPVRKEPKTSFSDMARMAGISIAEEALIGGFSKASPDKLDLEAG